MTASEGERRLAAVWFADIVGYTTLSARNEDAALQIVGTFQRLAEETVGAHGGRIVKYIGDAALAEFASTDGAVRSALALMQRFCEDEAVQEHGTTLRVGVNVGEVITAADGDIYGDGVNLAARLQNQAAPGQVVASDAVHTQIRQRPVFRSEALGHREMKGIASPVQLFAISLQEPGVTPTPSAAAAPAAAKKGGRRWGAPVGVAAVVALLAVWVLDPGGIVTRAGAPTLGSMLESRVDVTQTTFPVVEGGMEVGGSITVEFSREIDPATATSRNIRLLDADGAVVPAQVSLGEDGRSVQLDPTPTLAYGTRYILTVGDAVRGAGGEHVAGGGDGDVGLALPVETQPVPAGGPRPTVALEGGFDAQRAPVRGPVPLRFSAPIDPASAGEGGIRLTTRTGAAVAADLLFTDGNAEVRVEPRAALTRGGRYVVTVDSTVLSATGLAVVPGSLAFRVAPPPTPRPTQAASDPAPPPPVERTGPGTLNLTVSPAAARPFVRLVLNGDTLDTLPEGGLSLQEGRTHSVVLVGVPDLSAFTMTVFRRSLPVEPGEVVNLTAEITAFGSIDVASEPSGTVFIDGREVGRTPLAGYPVEAGVVHELEIRPFEADRNRVDVLTAEFRVEPLEWKSLGRLTLPPRR